jgi:hypothetical protein
LIIDQAGALEAAASSHKSKYQLHSKRFPADSTSKQKNMVKTGSFNDHDDDDDCNMDDMYVAASLAALSTGAFTAHQTPLTSSRASSSSDSVINGRPPLDVDMLKHPKCCACPFVGGAFKVA